MLKNNATQTHNLSAVNFSSRCLKRARAMSGSLIGLAAVISLVQMALAPGIFG